MKLPISLLLAASLALSGCSIFRRSAAWDTVVGSRSHYSDSAGGKDDYIQHLHRVLSDAGIEHKIVHYQFHYLNAYHEEAVEAAVAVLYRDDTTSRDPWWVMDAYHHVPTWLPNWELDAQLEFFIQRRVEVISVKSYAGGAPLAQRTAAAVKGRSSQPLIAHTPKSQKKHALFRTGMAKSKPSRPVKAHVAQADIDPLSASSLDGHSTDATDAIFRSAHGTSFDPTSSVDRQKMDALKRRLLNRTRSAQLRSE